MLNRKDLVKITAVLKYLMNDGVMRYQNHDVTIIESDSDLLHLCFVEPVEIIEGGKPTINEIRYINTEITLTSFLEHVLHVMTEEEFVGICASNTLRAASLFKRWCMTDNRVGS